MNSLAHIYANDKELAEARKFFHFQRVEDRLLDWCVQYVDIADKHRKEYYQKNTELWDKMWSFYMIPTPEQIFSIYNDIYIKYYQQL